MLPPSGEETHGSRPGMQEEREKERERGRDEGMKRRKRDDGGLDFLLFSTVLTSF